MQLDAAIAAVDIGTSVKTGGANQEVIVQRFLESIEKETGNSYTAILMPEQASFDYLIARNELAAFQLEVKIRSKYYEETIIPTHKEAVALADLMHHRLRTYLLAYYLDTKEMYLYDITSPPVKRDAVTRRDRNITNTPFILYS